MGPLTEVEHRSASVACWPAVAFCALVMLGSPSSADRVESV